MQTERDFYEFCDTLWSDWLEGGLDVPQFVRAEFDLDAAPEPYLVFGDATRPLVVLTTNPGGTMPHQIRRSILDGSSPILPSTGYAEAAREFSAFYLEHLTGPARHRIRAMTRLAELTHHDGVLQVETCPFHSPRLPKKASLVRLLQSEGLLGDYVEHLREFLRGRSVVVVSAVWSRSDLVSRSLELSPWLQWQLALIGLNRHAAKVVPLVKNDRRVTSVAIVDSTGGRSTAVVLMMGGNNLPGRDGLAILAASLVDEIDRVNGGGTL